MAHTVHWGDAPTWFAAVGGAVAAFYALRGFRAQRVQVAELAKKQTLTDTLLAYQAHTYARALTADVSVEWSPVEDPSERLISLKNLSRTSISNVTLVAALGGIACTVLDEARELVNIEGGSLVATTGWASPGTIKTSDSFQTVFSQTGISWTVRADGADADAKLTYTIEFDDEVGGRWAHDEADRVRLVNGPA
jgi:hypothetical protein